VENYTNNCTTYGETYLLENGLRQKYDRI